jgi:hypothetical protein
LWLINVLMVIVSPAAAFFGTLTRGFTPDAFLIFSFYRMCRAGI